jgi:hypothetical protein
VAPTLTQAQHIFDLPDACTYYGGPGDDLARAMAVSPSGEIFIVGASNSVTLPGTDSSGGGWDVFIAKFDPSLTHLLAATLLGGNATDLVYDAVIDSSGSLIIAGRTNSTTFPLTPGAYKTVLTAPSEIFITRLNSTLTLLEASTLVGPVISDNIYGHVCLAIDDQQRIYVSANTEDTLYPTTPGAFDQGYNGGVDAVISTLSSDLGTLLASTYLGDSSDDYALSLAVDDGEVWAAGRTNSADFPTTTSDSLAGTSDAFISRLTNDLQLLDASTLFGGVQPDEFRALALDGTGGVYAAGNTYSDSLAGSGFQDSLGGSQDGFIAHLSSSLTVQARTYLGGLSHDEVEAMIPGSDGLLYLCGRTSSIDFPKTWQGFDQVYENGEGFIAAITPDLDSLTAGGYLGGNNDERVYDLAQWASSLYFTGWTQSDTFWQTASAFDTLWNGSSDGFVLATRSLAASVDRIPDGGSFAEIRANYLYLDLQQPNPVAFDILTSDGRIVYSQQPHWAPPGSSIHALPGLLPAAYFVAVRIGEKVQLLKYFR